MKLELQVTKRLAHFDLRIDHCIESDGITAILGPSGSGKSTLLGLINGFTTPDQGSIRLDNEILIRCSPKQIKPIHQRSIATVFQEPLLFPHMKVIQNLNYGVSHVDLDYFETIVTMLNISPLLSRYPATLSGGEKQRIAIGRALLSRPKLLLMDEPLSSLDSQRKRELIDHIQQLSATTRIPMLFVSHNLNEVRRLADQIILMEQGEIIASGDRESILDHPSLADWI